MDFFLAKWVLLSQKQKGRILILLDYRFLQNDPELHILLAEMCLQAVMQQHWGPYEEDSELYVL